MALITNNSGMPYVWFEKIGPGGVSFDVLAVRGTFDFASDGEPIAFAKEQRPIVDGDEFEGPAQDNPLRAVLRREGDRVLHKPATDVYLTGTARSPNEQPLNGWQAGVRVGPVQKILQLHGPRHFVRNVFGWRLSKATPTHAIPLDYRLAFGGTYATGVAEEQTEYAYKPDNPAGCGWLPDAAALKDLSKPARKQILAEIGKLRMLDAPQIEDPRQPVLHPSQQNVTQGFGPVARWCAPRIGYAGTYDERWRAQRYPGVPDDFDLRFYQSAPPDLVCPGYLAGDETIVLAGLLPEGRVEMRLPGLRMIMAMTTRRGPGRVGPLALDTVAVDLDARQVSLVWRERFERSDPVHYLRLGAVVPPDSVLERAYG